MGSVIHNAIVVTSWSEEAMDKARTEAASLGLQCSPLVMSSINGYRSFLVAPDGSKSGWEDDIRGDDARAAFRAWLRGQRHEDGSSNYAWIEVAYGNDARSAIVVDHEWVNAAECAK